jgi:hypothetical protein
LHDTKYLLRDLKCAVNDLLAAIFAQAHGFFTYHVLFSLERFQSLFGMQPIGCANIQNVKIKIARQKLVYGAKKWHFKILNLTIFCTSRVYKRYELALIIAAYHFGVALAYVPGANNGKFDFPHFTILETILALS